MEMKQIKLGDIDFSLPLENYNTLKRKSGKHKITVRGKEYSIDLELNKLLLEYHKIINMDHLKDIDEKARYDYTMRVINSRISEKYYKKYGDKVVECPFPTHKE